MPEHRRESIEFATYESGKADQFARDFAPGHEQPWDHVLATHEPLSPPCLRWLLQESDLRNRLRE